MLGQVKLLNGFLDDIETELRWYALDFGVEPEMLLNSHEYEDGIVLWTVADELSCLRELTLDVEAGDRDLSFCWFNVPRQALEGRRLSSSVDSQQGEALTVIQSEGDSFDG